MWNKIINWWRIGILSISINAIGQTFTYSGYIKNADGSGAVNVPVKLYRRTTPTLTGFTTQTNYNGHSYYRSTGSAYWLDAKTACENMNGHLATVSDAAENTFLYNTWPSGWIGYYQDKTGGFYTEPSGGWRWTENYINDNIANYDIASYVSGSTLTDIKNSNNMTMYNSPVYTSTSGKYLTFNGTNNYAISPSLTSYFGSSNLITLMAWVYPTGNGVIVDELGTTSTSSGWHESVMEISGGNTLNCGFWSGSGITKITTAITLNQWYQVAITYDGTTLRGYKNGVLFGSTTFARQSPHLNGGGNEVFALGLADATNMGSGAYGAFRLGAFQVYNRVLSLDEINRCWMSLSYRFGLNPYLSWNGGEPNNSGGEDYAQFVSGGKWNDLPNAYALPYVIEFDYINDYTPWTLYQTVYTNSLGYYSFSQSTNPAVEWYLVFTAPTPVTPFNQQDVLGPIDIILSRISRKSVHWNIYDVNGDGKITISDSYYTTRKRYGRSATWPSTYLFTPTQYSTLTTGTSDLRSSVIGVSSITINSPVNGTTTGNYYLIAPGYKGQISY